jgi:anti-anti-sigma factor
MTNFTVQIQSLPKPDAFVCKVSGSIDMKTATELQLACNRLMVKGDERVLMDLSAVEYINSQGLGVLLQLQKQLNLRGGGVVASGLNERVKKVFLTTGVHKVVPLYDDAAAALSQDRLFQGR